ncbi:PP2C family protein-serine/threonine phosphatase [Streptomyces sp. AJS327]|uniref:PP2C family protein-serine/threonine phosphatase n=1 Tax=Streptomyces sp. AJS327 TaxID=2545265 RepID=UPI0027E4FF1C|nr:PP2C family protein-serine/threonine phosphatase [Streptomyces sp. AJS327]
MADNSDDRPYGRLQYLARLTPTLLLLAGVLIAILTPEGVAVTTPFAAAPVVAAAVQSTRATVLTGFAATTLAVAMSHWYIAVSLVEDVTRTLTVFTVSVLAVGLNMLLRRSGRRLASARSTAEAVQLAVLPTPPDRVGPLRLAAHYQAAQSDATIGGDMYAAQSTPHGARLLVGDVRGKGLGAVGAVAVVIGAFREAAEHEERLEDVAARLERALQLEGSRRPGSYDQAEGFTTAVLVEVPTRRPGLLRVINRGHPAPLLLDHGAVRVLEPSAPALPLGLGDVAAWPDQPDELPFPAGSQLLIFTDGLSEARNADGVFYDPAQRLARRSFDSPEALLRVVAEEVAEHTGGGTQDDMVLLAVENQDSGGGRAAPRDVRADATPEAPGAAGPAPRGATRRDASPRDGPPAKGRPAPPTPPHGTE